MVDNKSGSRRSLDATLSKDGPVLERAGTSRSVDRSSESVKTDGGSSVETVIDSDGNEQTIVTNPDGSSSVTVVDNGLPTSSGSVTHSSEKSDSGGGTVIHTVNPDGSITEVQTVNPDSGTVTVTEETGVGEPFDERRNNSKPDPYAGFEKPACPSGMPSDAYEKMCEMKEREYRQSINEKRAEEIMAQLSDEGYDVVGVQSALNEKCEAREPMAVMKAPDRTNGVSVGIKSEGAAFGAKTESVSTSSASTESVKSEMSSSCKSRTMSRFDNTGLSNVAGTPASNDISYDK